MHVVLPIQVHHDDYLAINNSKRNHSLLAVALPCVFTGNGEVVPDGLRTLEIQTVNGHVATAFGFIPRGHGHIVVTICAVDKWLMRRATSHYVWSQSESAVLNSEEHPSGNIARRDSQPAP